MDPKLRLWQAFTQTHNIATVGVPLFQTTPDGRVLSAPYGANGRLILCRSAAMEELLATRVESVLADTTNRLEGILYMMHARQDDAIIPLYIGRAGKYGKTGGVSANLRNIRQNKACFSRWGSNYAYHIGDLSAVTCPGHPDKQQVPKYRTWARALFEATPDPAPRLCRPVYFWSTTWGPDSPSIWQEYGPSSLSFQEYLLIGVASDLFPNDLLNREGVNWSS